MNDNNITEPTAEDYQQVAAMFTTTDQSQAPETVPADEAAGDSDSTEQPAEADDNPSRREARYRVQLRDAQTELAQMREQLTTMRRAQIDTHTTSLGIKPAALWATGTQLEDLLGDDGTPDAAKIDAAVTAARDTLGIIEKPKPLSPGSLRSGASRQEPRINQWANAFSPKEQ